MDNNIICCKCDCGYEFILGVPELLEQDQDAVIGELAWCGLCGSHHYECWWGVAHSGDSESTVRDVLAIWRKWAAGYFKQPNQALS